jgi:hypothetical protein
MSGLENQLENYHSGNSCKELENYHSGNSCKVIIFSLNSPSVRKEQLYQEDSEFTLSTAVTAH